MVLWLSIIFECSIIPNKNEKNQLKRQVSVKKKAPAIAEAQIKRGYALY